MIPSSREAVPDTLVQPFRVKTKGREMDPQMTLQTRGSQPGWRLGWMFWLHMGPPYPSLPTTLLDRIPGSSNKPPRLRAAVNPEAQAATGRLFNAL